MSLPIVERLRGLRGDYRLHCTQEAADTIEELMEALRRIKYRLDGYADVDGAIAIVDEALAKIGDSQ
jgi:hypothetical protein